MKTLGIVIPTLNAQRTLKRCLAPFFASPLQPEILIIDSSSEDGTVDEAKKLGAKTLIIPRKEFNHGLTREKGRRFLGTDIVIMMTPDAYFEEPKSIEKLIAPLLEKKAEAAYARQLPHKGAGWLEAFPRYFNYPSVGHIRSIEDLPCHGVYTFFCSNSCAAYSQKALDEVGGFSPVLLGEDTLAVAKLLRKGKKIAYVADSRVYHSHKYSLLQEFRRYFDTGLARQEYGSFLDAGTGDKRRGILFVKALFRETLIKAPWLLPYAFFQTLSRWTGYQLGKRLEKAPKKVKQIFSMHKGYWEN